MSHATKPARLPEAERAQPARMPALIIVGYAAAVYLLYLAVLGYAVGFFAGAGVPRAVWITVPRPAPALATEGTS